MENKNNAGRLHGRFVYCVFKDITPFEFIGVFLNPVHIQDCLGIDNGNIDKYVKGKTDTCKGIIVIKVDIGSNPLIISEIESSARSLIETRILKRTLLRMNKKSISKLSNNDLIKINNIINKSK